MEYGIKRFNIRNLHLDNYIRYIRNLPFFQRCILSYAYLQTHEKEAS